MKVSMNFSLHRTKWKKQLTSRMKIAQRQGLFQFQNQQQPANFVIPTTFNTPFFRPHHLYSTQFSHSHQFKS